MKTIQYLMLGLLLHTGVTFGQSTRLTESSISGILEDELPVLAVRYYYYPNLDAYFDTRTNLYIYNQNGQWVKGKEIANGYRGYSIFNNVRVEITDYDGDAPFTKLKEHQEKYPKKYTARRKPPKTDEQEAKVAFN